jgi:hypothetical protein
MPLMIAAFSIVPILVIGVGLLRPDLVLGAAELNASLVWSLLGTLVSYLGLVASSFALLEVTRLNRRYFAKQRLPEIKKRLEKITKSMPLSANQDLRAIRSQTVMAETAVMIRQIKGTKVPSMSELIKNAEAHRKTLEAKLNDVASLDDLANDTKEYWDLYSILTQLSQEIGEYEKGARASL